MFKPGDLIFHCKSMCGKHHWTNSLLLVVEETVEKYVVVDLREHYKSHIIHKSLTNMWQKINTETLDEQTLKLLERLD